MSSWGTSCEITEEDLTKWRSNPSSLGHQTLTGALYDAVCIGQPLLNTKVEVVAADGRRLSAEEPGEGDIWLGGSGRVCLVGEEVEADLNLMRRTGDVGVVDEKGSVYCLGRRDFQIKRFGHRMSLEVMEQVSNAGRLLWVVGAERKDDVCEIATMHCRKVCSQIMLCRIGGA